MSTRSHAISPATNTPGAFCGNCNIVSVSGGKDSTALLLLALERQAENLSAVFADTGNEHDLTYEYVRYLEEATGIRIQWVKADFSEQIEAKRQRLLRIAAGEQDKHGIYRHTPESAKRAADSLRATGNPFLDLCIWKGRFPSTTRRFCSEELKRNVILEQVMFPLLDAGNMVYSWQGVRADESPARANLPEIDEVGGGLWNYRPILKWTVDDVFAMHKKHGIKPNPLYSMGMGRVGCMPCINARKDELLEIARRFPDVIDRIDQWELVVAKVSKRCAIDDTIEATFFPSPEKNAGKRMNGIRNMVEWSKTARGGDQYDFLRTGEAAACSSIYGLCE